MLPPVGSPGRPDLPLEERQARTDELADTYRRLLRDGPQQCEVALYLARRETRTWRLDLHHLALRELGIDPSGEWTRSEHGTALVYRLPSLPTPEGATFSPTRAM